MNAMRITVELSLYPLQDNPIPVIQRFIADLADRDGVEVLPNQMSTQLRGEFAPVMAVVTAAVERSFAAPGHQVLVAKFINADLPISTPPEL